MSDTIFTIELPDVEMYEELFVISQFRRKAD